MTHWLLSEEQVEDLMTSKEGRKILVKVFMKMAHRLFCVAYENERLWGPAHQALSDSYKMMKQSLECISDLKRFARERDKR